jgi:hypothetical protein
MELPMFKKIEYYGTILTKEYAEYVDKIEAKRIVKDLCGEDIQVAKLIKILEQPEDIFQDDLDSKYIIKSAHGSGWNVNINDKTSLSDIIIKLRNWNTTYVGNREKQYSYIKPRFFIEEKIYDSILGHTGEALVYMIRCIHSKPISISVKYKNVQNSYDTNWNLITSKIPFDIPKPKCLSKLLNLCETLSARFEFVRLDFYIGNNNTIYFSEFTFTPNGGFKVFDIETEIKQGSLWT